MVLMLNFYMHTINVKSLMPVSYSAVPKEHLNVSFALRAMSSTALCAYVKQNNKPVHEFRVVTSNQCEEC